MSKEGLSRRSFLRDTAIGSTGVALASLPMAHAAAVEALPEPPYPVTLGSNPLTAADKAVSQMHLRLVAARDFPDVYKEKMKTYAPNLEIKACRSGEEFRREVVDAHILFPQYGAFYHEDFLAAKHVRWIQFPATGVEAIMFPELVEGPRRAHEHGAYVFPRYFGNCFRSADYPYTPPA